MKKRKSKYQAHFKGSKTERYHNEAMERKKNYEEMMETGEHAECLKEELTMQYLINNLLLITAQN